MKRFIFAATIFAFVLCGYGVARSQTGEPPGLDLPIDEESATATVEESVEASVIASAEESVTAQEAIDDADTGTEIVILAILSLVGGFGLFLIKKYFDSKKFSI